MDNTIALFIEKLHENFRDCSDGAVADDIPELAKLDPSLFGICVVTTDGHEITCYTLSRDRLAELFDSHPQIYAAILRNLLILNFGRLRRRNLEIAALKT